MKYEKLLRNYSSTRISLVWSKVELNITCTYNAINFAHNK